MPTETEIYILPNGEIVVADLPEELATLLAQLTQTPAPTTAENSDLAYVTQQQHPTDPT